MTNSADLVQKPTDLDLQCLLRQGMSCSAREGLNSLHFKVHKCLRSASSVASSLVSNQILFQSKLITSYNCLQTVILYLRGVFEMNCLFLSGDFKFQVSPKVLISCPRSTPCG